MSRYSWVTNSFSLTGAIPTTPQTLDLFIPAASTVKRFQLRGCYISMFSSNVDASHVCAPEMTIQIDYGHIFEPTRTIYTSHRRIPLFCNAYVVPPAIPVHEVQASAGDLELGVDQPCSYGKLTEPSAGLILTTSIYAYPFLNSDYTGEWDLTLAALVFT